MDKLNFKDLKISEEILKSVQLLGYVTLSDVQNKVIPLVLDGKDVIVQSETGSGKTAAFAIPICEKIELEKRKPQVLVLTPTRELAVQVKEDISNIGRFKKIRCAAIYGKQPMTIQVRELKQRVHIVVGTPGRTLDHIEKGNLDLEEVKYLVVDEADEMLNMGFVDQVEAIIKVLPHNRITMLFSATLPEKINNLCNEYMINPIRVEINPDNVTVDKIIQCYYKVEEKDKLDLLNKIIYTEAPDSCVIFCNTKGQVDKLSRSMQDKGYSCFGLHGGMEQKDRLNTINSFKRGEFRFLVSTDVLSRGIHIEDVTHVINYDLPVEKESYVHRIGRTGRAGNDGIAITFVCPYEYRMLSEIEEYVRYSIPVKDIPTEAEIQKGKDIFKKKIKSGLKLKNDKSTELNKNVTKLYINAGKKKKLRAGDIVGAITSIKGITMEDIGIIDVQENVSYVDILGDKGEQVLKVLQTTTIKGKQIRAEKALK